MGGCCATTFTLDEHTRYINEKLAVEHRHELQTNKLLFLGPGGSGKSTIFKQLQWLHGGGFTKEDALMLKEHIYCQITSQMKNAIKRFINEHKDNEIDLVNAISIVEDHGDVTTFNDELADSIKYIWNNHTEMQNVFKDMQTTQNKILDETTEYFWNEIDRIKVVDYVPNERDIMNVRYRTTGVIEKQFEIKGAKFHIFDVGGQKSERKKWINCFNQVKALIFVIALSCYNERMYEDLNKNCMVDSLALFEETINNKLFYSTHIILFLNKKDLFIQKIIKIPITECPAFTDFEEYHHQSTIHSNPNDFEQTTSYIRCKFEALNRYAKRKQVYTHLTCAMDQKNIQNVFNDVKFIVITQNLYNEGLS